MTAIFWWALPHSFAGFIADEKSPLALEKSIFNWAKLENNRWLYQVLERYIDLTGSQQYWDFFAPQSPKLHQYLSVCTAIKRYPTEQKIDCQYSLMSNFYADFAQFRVLGSDRSRWYRLTENLSQLADSQLLQAFSEYYRPSPAKHLPAFIFATPSI